MDAKTLEDFLAKQEITETLMLHFRGVDRLDRELTVGSFHPGAVIDYGRLFKGDAEQMADWIWANHSHMRFSCHLATNVVVEVDGDRGFSECYMFTALRMDQGTPDPGVRHADASSAEAKQKLSDVFFLNRYIDHWARRDGRWGITRRLHVEEFSHPFEVVPGPFADAPGLHSRFDKDDAFYVEHAAWKAGA